MSRNTSKIGRLKIESQENKFVIQKIYFAIGKSFYEENHEVFLVPGKSSLYRNIRNKEVRYMEKRCAAFPFETGIHFRRKTDFFPEEDTTKSYSGFEPTRLQAEGHSHHTGWATN
ncbi:hypothetical protein TNCV_848361 [Trichonephila clavipes]|uniref:Uncharacterized protein n=1 Tax=Trichonephila clavipes TaxID=2585209 RepID=A0A8X6RJD4_TRICX|nr:hypothetical protein TNCV_848361 [Trichonephila clavipes]